MSDAGADGPETAGPGGWITRPGRWLAALVSFFAHCGIATLLVAIVLTCADIAWRRAVGGAFVDTVDITKLCLVAAASLSVPYGFTRGTHVTVDLLADRFPERTRAGLEIAISLAAAGLLALLLWLSWQAAALHYAYGDTSLNLRIPIVYYWALLLLGLMLAVLSALARAAETTLVLTRGGPVP